MLYKLSIKPTRLELLKLISLDKSTYKEIRVAVRPLPFRFNRGMIDSDVFFQQFVDLLNDFLETYRQDISELFISLKENYFQVYKLPANEIDDDVVQWEIAQYLTDDATNYKYGVYFDQDAQKRYLVVARTKLIEYFQGVIKSLFGSINFTAVGFDLKSTKNETVFIKADKEIKDFYRFGYVNNWNQENTLVETDTKSGKSKTIILSVSLIASVVIGFWLWPKNNIQVSEPLPAAKPENKIASAVKDSTNTPVTITPATAQQTSSNLKSTYGIIQQLLNSNFNTLIINRNKCIIDHNLATDANQTVNLLKTSSSNKDLTIIGRDKNIIQFTLPDSAFYSLSAENLTKFKQLSTTSKLSDKYNYRLFTTPGALSTFIGDLQKNSIQFSHLLIAHRGNIYSLAIEFN